MLHQRRRYASTPTESVTASVDPAIEPEPLHLFDEQQYIERSYCSASPNVATVSFKQDAAHLR